MRIVYGSNLFIQDSDRWWQGVLNAVMSLWNLEERNLRLDELF
jgi:hypothetical protein